LKAEFFVVVIFKCVLVHFRHPTQLMEKPLILRIWIKALISVLGQYSVETNLWQTISLHPECPRGTSQTAGKGQPCYYHNTSEHTRRE